MKSLLDIQLEIRQAEAYINDVIKLLRNIDEAISELGNERDLSGTDYDMVRTMAKNIDFPSHPISLIDNIDARRLYIKLLLIMIRLGKNHTISNEQLAFIQWIMDKAEIGVQLEELIIECFKQDDELIYNAKSFFSKEQILSLIEDMLITVNLSGEMNSDTAVYIAEISEILKLSKDDLKRLSCLAKLVLCRRPEDLDKDDLRAALDHIDIVEQYIDDIIMDKCFDEARVFVCAVSKDEYYKWSVKNKCHVEKNDEIGSFNNYKSSQYNRLSFLSLINGTETTSANKVSLSAPASGTLFQFEYCNKQYGVISSSSDNIGSIKKWVKQNNNQSA